MPLELAVGLNTLRTTSLDLLQFSPPVCSSMSPLSWPISSEPSMKRKSRWVELFNCSQRIRLKQWVQFNDFIVILDTPTTRSSPRCWPAVEPLRWFLKLLGSSIVWHAADTTNPTLRRLLRQPLLPPSMRNCSELSEKKFPILSMIDVATKYQAASVIYGERTQDFSSRPGKGMDQTFRLPSRAGYWWRSWLGFWWDAQLVFKLEHQAYYGSWWSSHPP